MTIHVPIGDAEARLGELVAAAVRGENVVLDQAGRSQVRLVPIDPPSSQAHRQTSRAEALGIFSKAFEGFDLGLRALKADRSSLDEYYRHKFADID